MKITKASLSKDIMLPLSEGNTVRHISMKKDDCIEVDLDSIEGNVVIAFVNNKPVELFKDEYTLVS